MTETHQITLTMHDLREAINGFGKPSERRATASAFIDLIRRSPGLFDIYSGKISDKSVELWIPDISTRDEKHYISVSTEGRGRVRYERVKQGIVLQESIDRLATRSIEDVLTEVGVLSLIED